MFASRTNNQPDAPTGLGGKLFATLFGLFFMAIPLLFIWLIARDAIGGAQTWTWRKTACEITASDVGQTNRASRQTGDFVFKVRYRYTFGGRQLSSEQYARNPETSGNYAKIARLTERYAPGASAVCYVNPAAPAQAVLVRSNLFVLLFALFPMIFVAIGATVIFAAWRRKSAAALPISDRLASARGWWAKIVFLSVFLLVGLAGFYGFFLRPMFKILNAKTWPEVPCVVISSEVKRHSGGRNTTYSINLFYRYEINGRALKSNTYAFMGGSSSGYAAKNAVVARNPPGTKTVCYVNPDDPLEAVLIRGFTPDMWVGLIPLLFVVVGTGGLFFVFRQSRKNAFARAPSPAIPAASTGGMTGPLLLKPVMPFWAKLLGAIFACLFWNGIVSVFVGEAVSHWRSGRPEWWLMLFLIPFVAIGLMLVVAVLYRFLALFDPRPRLRVAPGAVPLGATLQVQWNLTGRTGMLQNLTLRLEGREEATNSRGKNTVTARSVFANLEIASTATAREMRSGEARVTLPGHLVPSFAGRHNKIIWIIRVRGEIARWPDVNEEFPLTVLPSAPPAR